MSIILLGYSLVVPSYRLVNTPATSSCLDRSVHTKIIFVLFFGPLKSPLVKCRTGGRDASGKTQLECLHMASLRSSLYMNSLPKHRAPT